MSAVVPFVFLLCGCGGEATWTGRVDPVPSSPGPTWSAPPPPVVELRDGGWKPIAVAPPPKLEPEPEPVVAFQPGFHQALRWSYDTPGRVTFRYRVPVGRAGKRLRVAFVAGDGGGTLLRATVARAGTGGELASTPVALTFNGSASGASLQPRERVVSDPLAFKVARMEELYVSFAAEGSWASSAIDAFPDSYIAWDDQTRGTTLHDEAPRQALTGLNTIEVEAAPSLAFVALGDSITEGYVSGHDDARNAWPTLATAESGVPVANAAVSGQGLYDAIRFLGPEVKVLNGVTDCVALIGTNDLAAKEAPELEADLAELFGKLRGFCRVWAGTLLPKEKTSQLDLATVNARRNDVNDWLRHHADVTGVVDLEEAVRDPDDWNRFLPGYAEDGIHPSVTGQQALGEYVAQRLSVLAGQ